MTKLVLCAAVVLALAGCSAKPRADAQAATPGSTCSAPANQVCEGCSVVCASGQHAMCQAGQLTSGDNPACWTLAKCECQ